MEEEIQNDVAEEVTEEVVENVEGAQDIESTDVQEQPDIDKLVEERANQLTEERISKRLAREKRKYEKEISKYKRLGQIVETGLGVSGIDEAITKTRDFYNEQGIDIPEENTSREWEEQVLGKAEAEQIISYGYEEMEAEANRIASIPQEKRTTREKALFNELCNGLISMRDEQELQGMGVDKSILQDNKFKEFRGQFNSNVKLADIYSMYNKMTGNEKQIPASPGSAKTSTPVSQVADYISLEDFDKLTDEQLNDPRIMAIVDKSRPSWYKE